MKATIPADGNPLTAALRFQDGVKGDGQPVKNVITAGVFSSRGSLGWAYSHAPVLGSGAVLLRPEVSKNQLPGDCNQDGQVDQSDAICLLLHVFLGGPPEVLPCGNGKTSDPGNRSLLDFNGDSGIDQSDAIGILSWKFLGGPPHLLGIACTPIADCPAVSQCQ